MDYNKTFRPRTNSISYAHLIRALTEGNMSRKELREESGLSESTIRSHLTALKRLRLIKVTDWERRHGIIDPLFSICTPDDAHSKPRPKPLSCVERRRAYVARKRLKVLEQLGVARDIPPGYNAPVPAVGTVLVKEQVS